MRLNNISKKRVFGLRLPQQFPLYQMCQIFVILIIRAEHWTNVRHVQHSTVIMSSVKISTLVQSVIQTLRAVFTAAVLPHVARWTRLTSFTLVRIVQTKSVIIKQSVNPSLKCMQSTAKLIGWSIVQILSVQIWTSNKPVLFRLSGVRLYFKLVQKTTRCRKPIGSMALQYCLKEPRSNALSSRAVFLLQCLTVPKMRYS